MIESTLNYLAEMEERSTYYRYEPPAGTPWRDTRGDRRTMPIHDARSAEPQPSLDREGFALVGHATGLEDLYDPEAVRRSGVLLIDRRSAPGVTAGGARCFAAGAATTTAG